MEEWITCMLHAWVSYISDNRTAWASAWLTSMKRSMPVNWRKPLNHQQINWYFPRILLLPQFQWVFLIYSNVELIVGSSDILDAVVVGTIFLGENLISIKLFWMPFIRAHLVKRHFQCKQDSWTFYIFLQDIYDTNNFWGTFLLKKNWKTFWWKFVNRPFW